MTSIFRTRRRSPSELAVAFNGEELESRRDGATTIRKYQTPGPTFPTLVAGAFEVVRHGTEDGPAISFYHQPGYAAVAETIIAHSEKVIALLAEWTGAKTRGVRKTDKKRLEGEAFTPPQPDPS